MAVMTTTRPSPADERLAEIGKAIGHPVRAHILRRLIEAGACLCADFVNDLGLAQSTLWKHLDILRDAGLVKSSKDKKTVFYCVDPAALAELGDLTSALRARCC